MHNVTTAAVLSFPSPPARTLARTRILTRLVALVLTHAPAGAGLCKVLDVLGLFGEVLELAVAEGLPVADGAHALASLGMLRGFRASTEQSLLRASDAARLAEILSYVETRNGPAIDLVRCVAEVNAGSESGAAVIAIRLVQFAEHHRLPLPNILGPVVGFVDRAQTELVEQLLAQLDELDVERHEAAA